jgi:predicted aldo/keto reductase-like oxidoreductase
MEYRRFGKTNKFISAITLGGMRFKHGWEKPRDELPKASIENCLEITKKAFDMGINHIETAYGYGKSEHLYGLVLKELSIARDKYFLMTKGCANTAEEMKVILESQLKGLQTDRFDFYGFHGINNREILDTAVKKDGPVSFLLKMKEQGVIGNIGFSTHAPLNVILDTIQTDLFDFMNLHYYYFFQRNNPAVELAAHKDMGIFIISPNEKGGQLFKPSQKVKDACSPLTPIQFNARFCLSHPKISTLSFGFNELNHFNELNGMFNGNHYLNGEDRNIKIKLDSFLGALNNTFCTYCAECLPCPERINIPELLRFRNMGIAYEMQDFGVYRYNMLESKGHWFPGTFGNTCTDCGDCLPKCPVHLDIPKLVRDTHQMFYREKKV